MWEAASLVPYRIQDSEMRPAGADGSASPKAAHSSRYTEGLHERFEPRVEKVPVLGGLSSFLSFPHNRLDCVRRHSFCTCQKCPLILVRTKFRIDKNTVSFRTRKLLQRQRDQVTKTSLGHRVLVGKKRS